MEQCMDCLVSVDAVIASIDHQQVGVVDALALVCCHGQLQWLIDAYGEPISQLHRLVLHQVVPDGDLDWLMDGDGQRHWLADGDELVDGLALTDTLQVSEDDQHGDRELVGERQVDDDD